MIVTTSVNGQYLLGMQATYNDSFRSWEVSVEMDSTTTIEGSLSITWDLRNDFSDWSFSIGDYDGTISQVFNNNAGRWELRSGNNVVSITQTWPGDTSEWDIRSKNTNTKMITTIDDNGPLWINKERKNGELAVYMERNGDPRVWIIEDYMNADVPFLHRLASAFISIYASCPKL